MKIRDFISQFFPNKRENTMDESKVEDILLQAIIGDTEITREKALEIPAVSASVDLICSIFSTIPFKLYRETITEGKKCTEEVDDIRASLINEDTRDTLDGFQFKKAICEDYLLGKGGYAYINKKGNSVLSIHYTEDKYICFQKNYDPIFKSFDILVNGRVFYDFEFLKVLRNTKDGAEGIGVTKEIGKALKTGFRRLLYEYDLTVTGGSRKGFVKSKKHLDPKAMQELKNAWTNYYAGNSNTVILNDGIDFQEASNTSKENEINEKNKTFDEEIKGIFHIKDAYEETIKEAIIPIATAFATALNRDLLLESEKDTYYFAPDTKELFKGSMKERFESYQIAIKNGWLTRNEVRYIEDYDAIEGLDIINLGLADVLLDTKTGKIYTPNTNSIVNFSDDNLSGNLTDSGKGGEEDES